MFISGRAAVFLILSYALGPGLLVNVALKDNWGRPRPVHITHFGGDKRFTAFWDFRGVCQRNCSFVSGEAASAAWTIAPAALAPSSWRPLAYGAALTFYIAIALLRIAVGAHFLSDIIFAGVITFLVIWLIYALIYRWRSTRLSDEAVENALERFSSYCRSAMLRLIGRPAGQVRDAKDSNDSRGKRWKAQLGMTMSAIGTKRTCLVAPHMSAIGGLVDGQKPQKKQSGICEKVIAAQG